MVKGLSANAYTQANAGALRNGENSIYSNLGASVGIDTKLQLDKKNAIFGQFEFGAGTALTGNARLGYQRALSNNTNLVFAANAALGNSLTKTENSSVHIDNKANINDKIYQMDKIDKTFDWKPGNISFSGQVGFNKNAKWGSYELGAELGYEHSSSVEYSLKGGSHADVLIGEQKTEIQTAYDYNRKEQEGMYISPYATARIDLNKKGNWQAIGKADIHEIKVGLRYNF